MVACFDEDRRLDVAQLLGEKQLHFDFDRGTPCYREKVAVFAPGAARVSFRNVGGDGNSSAPQLGCQSKSVQTAEMTR